QMVYRIGIAEHLGQSDIYFVLSNETLAECIECGLEFLCLRSSGYILVGPPVRWPRQSARLIGRAQDAIPLKQCRAAQKMFYYICLEPRLTLECKHSQEK